MRTDRFVSRRVFQFVRLSASTFAEEPHAEHSVSGKPLKNETRTLNICKT